MKFINRQQELTALERIYHQDGFQFIPVYGRRRIGKTRLVQEFIKDKGAVYFLADSVSETEQLRSLGRIAGEYFHDPILMDRGFKDWRQFFSYVRDKQKTRLSRQGKITCTSCLSFCLFSVLRQGLHNSLCVP